MSLSPDTAHLDLAAAGVAIAVVTSIGLRSRPEAASIATSVAAVATAVVLAATGQASWLLVAGIILSALAAVAAITPLAAGRVSWGLAVAGIAVVIVALQDPSKSTPLLVALAGAALLLSAARVRPAAAPVWSAVLIIASLVGTFLGAPDTEAAVIGLTALVPIYFYALLEWPDRGRFDHHALLLLVAWTAVDSYRGRPAGMTSALVALAPVAVAALGFLALRNPMQANVLTAVLALGACVIAGRTIGLSHARTPEEALAGITGAALILGSGLLSFRSGVDRRPVG